jgi:branched-chain amino acid transport system substrate-binding protein
VKRRDFISGIRLPLGAAAAAFLGLAVVQPQAADPIVLGVSGPLTGANAQYGAQWKAGFDLALDQINGAGGIKGRQLQYVFEDSQSDPRQSVAIAQKFVNDPKIAAELGDLSSPASMAASPIYQRAKLVQFGFTNSHRDFTKGGDYMWSNAVNQADEVPLLAELAVKRLGLRRLAVIHLNSDWGRTGKDIFVKAAKEDGAEVVATEGFLPDEKDYRSTLVRVRDAKPNGIVIIAYYADGALIARQLQATGVKLPVVAGTSVYSPKFLELGGDAVNGIHITANFFPEDTRPEVQTFVKAYRAKYRNDPDAFAAIAYDTIILFSEVITQYGADRKAIRDGLAAIKDVPSVIYGKVTFDPQTRRVFGAKIVNLVIKDGKFVLWDGTKSAVN